MPSPRPCCVLAPPPAGPSERSFAAAPPFRTLKPLWGAFPELLARGADWLMVAVRCPGFPGSEETREGAAMALVRQPLRELQGPLLPPKNLEDEDEDCVREDAEDDEDLEFVDAEELCGGGVKAGTLPGRVRGEGAAARGSGTAGGRERFRVGGSGGRPTIQALGGVVYVLEETAGRQACVHAQKETCVLN